MAEILDWRAATDDGRELQRAGFKGPGAQLPESVREVRVSTDVGDLRVKVGSGARVGIFTRRRMAVNLATLQGSEPEGTVVIEVHPPGAAPGQSVRLYIGSEVVISTEDLYG